jgi:hypothetical protein
MIHRSGCKLYKYPWRESYNSLANYEKYHVAKAFSLNLIIMTIQSSTNEWSCLMNCWRRGFQGSVAAGYIISIFGGGVQKSEKRLNGKNVPLF